MSKGDFMKNFKVIRKAGAIFFACMVLALFSADSYLQASEVHVSDMTPPEYYAASGEETAVQEEEEAQGMNDIPEVSSDGSENESMPESGTESSEAQEEIQTEGSGDQTDPEKQTESGTENETNQNGDLQSESEAVQTELAEQTEMRSETEEQTGEKAEITDQPESSDQSETAGQMENGGQEETAGQTELTAQEESEDQTGIWPEEETDTETGGEESTEDDEDLALDKVLEEAQRQDIDIFGLAPGESLTFYTSIGEDDGIMTMAVTAVTVTRASSPYKYADYGYGNLQTYKYTVSFNDITATAYCIRPTLDSPGSGQNYTVKKIKGAKTLAKVCYYGTKAAGSEGFFEERHPKFNAGQRFIITHLAAAYANGSPDAFAGANEKAQKLAMELYEYCVDQPDIPDVDMEFSNASVTAYIDTDNDPKQQRTEEITFQADSAQSITFDLPSGVVLHNLTTGKASSAGAKVKITGGTKFYLSAPLTQAADVGAVWSSTMKGSLTKDYSAYRINTGSETQPLVLVFGDGVEEECYIDFSVTWVNMVSVEVLKTDAKTNKPIAGAVFGIYADENCSTLLAALPATDQQGKASASLNQTQDVVYLKEITSPQGYLLSAVVTPIDLKNGAQTGGVLQYTFTNDRITAGIQLIKKDAQTGTPQGDAVLEHAVYGVYAREDIVHPDGSTGVLFHAGDQVAVLTTDAEGKASVDDLYLGKYYVKEITPPTGYLLDENEYDFVFEGTDGKTETLKQECVSMETVIRQPFQLIKIGGAGKTDMDTLEGAGFSAYLVSALQRRSDGSYDFSSADPVVLGKNGETEIFTDATGYAASIPLPFGTYIVRETTVPNGFKPVDDFEVRITENNPDKPQAWRVLMDEEFEAKLKIIKSDDETQKNVLEANTEFKVYDIDSGKYVEQVTTYPKEEIHTSYFTDEEGSLILPQSLPRGHYRIEEVLAPDGYTLGKNVLEVTIDNNVAYRMDDISQDAIIEVVASNHPVKGRLVIVKKGDVLKNYENGFVYEKKSLSGAVFDVYAAEDIYTADFQRDEDGSRILEYAGEALVGEVSIGENGEGILDDLPLGKYKVVEKTAPDGYVLSSEEQYVQFVYVDQDTPVVTETVEFVNDRPKVEITAVKKNSINGDLLAGAEFGLYAKEDIKVNDMTIVRADTQLATAETGEDGKAVFEQDLPFGTYYVRELRAPEGFILSEETVDLSASYKGQETAFIQLEAAFENTPTTVEFTKSDITTGVELDGAAMSVLDQKGNVIDSWVSEKEKPHVIHALHVGETYVLREESAPYGYLRAEEVEFTVADSGEIQKVNMEDEVPVGRIIISKTGEFVNSVTWNEMVAGTMEAVFGYLSGSLKEVVFEVHAAEDIKAADGVSSDYYKKDELVEEIATDSLGYARSKDLPLGKYYVVEKETEEGFVLDDEPRQVDLTYRDQDTPVVTYDETWQNCRQKVRVTVLKKEKGTGQALAGGVFALCTRDDITGTDGKILLNADAVIEQKVTGADGRLAFEADLPLGGTYYVKEVKAPAGYAATGERKEFTFSYAGEDTKEVVFDYSFENQPTRVKLSKTDATTGKELPGARLEVRDEEGNIVDKWISSDSPHMIEGLEAGKVYTLREESAPRGYVIAEEIRFRVLDTEKIQSVIMKDDCVSGKVLLHKTDQITGKPLEGVEFTLYDSKGRKLETMVTDEDGNAESAAYPVMVSGKKSRNKEALYTLKETKALPGYRLDETEHKIQFSGEDDETPVEEYKLELKNERIADAPATGDETDILLPGAAMTLSGFAAAALFAIQKRKKKLS